MGTADSFQPKEHEKQYFPAVKLLHYLEKIHLPIIRQYPFGRKMDLSIPHLRERIVRGVLESVNEWFLLVRASAVEVGKFALKQGSMELTKENIRSRSKSTSSDFARKKQMEKKISYQPEFAGLDLTEVSVFHTVPNLTFSPIFQAFAVHEELGDESEFIDYYQKNRRMQCDLAVDLSEKSFSTYFHEYFQAIAGFFIVTDSVFQSAPQLVPQNFKLSLWEHALDRLRSELKENVNDIVDPLLLGELKDLTLLFCRTMKVYDYDVNPILEFVSVILRDRYLEVTRTVTIENLESIFRSDNFLPLEIKAESDSGRYAAKLDLISLFPPSNPHSFQFSKMLPLSIRVMIRFISSAWKFSLGDFVMPDMERRIVHQTGSLLEIIPRNYANMILESEERVLDLSLRQICVALVNITLFERTLSLYTDKMALLDIGASAVMFHKKESFDYAYRNIEFKLVAVIQTYVSEIFEKASGNFEWLATKPSDTPRDYIVELSQFTTEYLPGQLDALPIEKQHHLFHEFFRIISVEFQNFLARKKVSFNRVAVSGLLVDLESIRRAAQSVPAPGAVNNFDEVLELFTLLTTDGIEEFLDANVRSQKYPHLKNWRKLSTIFAYYKEDSSVMSRFSFFQDDRTKNVIKIREFINSQF
eukprot:TRINITY_DN7591_c0_g1_i1.p1 TRINITY_DN7591_c0_g1~~TRINITY_DN7591_c0_g1_i1.p1  ORF type:complete len:746 (+),score=186.66 TRINITY_DN7591_c0_g1_i1:307-2238(+)